MATTPNEFQKNAKAIIALVFAAASAALAYPDLIPVHGNIKTALTTAAVFITGISVWLKKNAPVIEADAQKIEDKAHALGVKVPDLSAWADQALSVLGVDSAKVTPALLVTSPTTITAPLEGTTPQPADDTDGV